MHSKKTVRILRSALYIQISRLGYHFKCAWSLDQVKSSSDGSDVPAKVIEQ